MNDQDSTPEQVGDGFKRRVVKASKVHRSRDGKPAWRVVLSCSHYAVILRRQCPCHERDIVPRLLASSRCALEAYYQARREQRAKRKKERR